MKPLFSAVLLAGALCSPFDLAPPDAVEFAPPAEYLRWYAEVEACLMARGAFPALRWLVTDHAIPHSDGAGRPARLLRPDRVLIWRPFLGSPSIVKHESMHHVLYVASGSWYWDARHQHPLWDVCA